MSLYDYDVIIAGSGPAGLTASLYLARAGFNVLNITGEEPGGELVNIKILENYPGVKTCSGLDLWKTMMCQCKDAGVKFLEYVNVESFSVFGTNDLFAPVHVFANDGTTLISKAFISCIGGSHRTLGLEGEENYFGDGISFCASCDGPLYKNKNVVVIGGGNSAMDFASTLSNYCRKVEIIHRRDTFRADLCMVAQVLKRKNISINYNTHVTKIERNNIRNNFELHTLKSDGNESIFTGVDGIFYALGFDKKYISCDISGMNHGTFFADGNQVVNAAGEGCNVALKCIEFLNKVKEF